eukprot:8016781-Karenia_brevis.AAC.1
MILGDGTVVGSLVQKYYCEKCNTMPVTEGNGMKTGPDLPDILIVRAIAPNHKDLATIKMF